MSMYIARHGRRGDGGGLSPEGESHARLLAGQLEWLVGATALYLSSSEPCAVETARFIRRQLRDPQQLLGRTLVKSHYMHIAGLQPSLVGSLQAYANEILEACGLEPEDRNVVLITHAPLVNAVAGSGTGSGTVTEVPEAWICPEYDPDLAARVRELEYSEIPAWIGNPRLTLYDTV